MAVFKRKTSAGETKEYHYRFKLGGKDYYGVCPDCTTQESAKSFEKGMRKNVSGIRAQKTVKGLVENYKEILSGENKLPLGEVWEKYEKKMQAGIEQKKLVLKRWGHFKKYINRKYPDIININQITARHAVEYIDDLRTDGTVVNHRNKKGELKEFAVKISDETKNKYLSSLKSIFSKMTIVAGLIENPFANIKGLKKKAIEREAFTIEELKLIGESSKDTWIYPLFLTALYTGLREGDVCTLRWKEIDYNIGANGVIKKKMNKTGETVEIPILEPLQKYLDKLPREEEYCFPELANRYMNHRKTIGQKVTVFIKGLGIKKHEDGEGRARKTSIKDVHSCRHTFAYLAAKHGVPFPVVQKILGHITDKMTESYMNHATLEEKERALRQIPDYLNGKTKVKRIISGKEISERVMAILRKHMDSPLKRDLLNFLRKIETSPA